MAFDLFENVVLQTLNGLPRVDEPVETHVHTPAVEVQEQEEVEVAQSAQESQEINKEPSVPVATGEACESRPSDTEGQKIPIKRPRDSHEESFASVLQQQTEQAKQARISVADSIDQSTGIPGAVAGFTTVVVEAKVVSEASEASTSQSTEVSRTSEVFETNPQSVRFFTQAGFSVVPQDLIDKRLVVVDAKADLIYPISVSVGASVQSLIDAEFKSESGVKAWSVLGHSIALHDLVDNWQCIVLGECVPDVDELSCEIAQVRLCQMPRYKSLLYQGARVATDEMMFYLQSFAHKYGVHCAFPFVVDNSADIVLLADAWFDVSSDGGKHDKFVSASLVGGHWTPAVVTKQDQQYQIITDAVGASTWQAFNVQGVSVQEVGQCDSHFTNDCGFQTVAWLSHHFDAAACSSISYDAAATLRFMFWQDVLMNPEQALRCSIVMLGGHASEVQIALAAILREHGVFSERALSRANNVLEKLGVSTVEAIIHSARPWVALKQKANQHNPKIQLVFEDEFQKVVEARSRNSKPV